MVNLISTFLVTPDQSKRLQLEGKSIVTVFDEAVKDLLSKYTSVESSGIHPAEEPPEVLLQLLPELQLADFPIQYSLLTNLALIVHPLVPKDFVELFAIKLDVPLATILFIEQ